MGWLGMGSYVGSFEDRVQQFLGGQRHVVAVSTGHAALHLAFLLAGVTDGDEVITPAFNNVADFQAILACGARPVFCDIDNTTLCLDVEQARGLISPQTKAIIAMDYGCGLADHDRVQQLADQHGLRVIHDAAHSFGSKTPGGPVGSFSDLCMFSFDPVKTITCIDGGALVVRTEDEAERVREMRLIGMTQRSSVMYEDKRAWTYDVRLPGFRYHMANLHAAIGLAQLGRLDSIASSRREIYDLFREAFDALPNVQAPQNLKAGGVPFLFYLRVPEDRRADFRDHLTARGVDTGIHWQPGHRFTLFKDCRAGDLSVTERVSREIVTIPLHSFMSPTNRDRVIQAVRSFFDE